jgi:hypothetical protein
MDEIKNIPIPERLKNLEEQAYKDKSKKLRFPMRAKVNSSRLKKGWIGCLTVGENRIVTGEKLPVEDGAYRTKDGTYHTLDGHEILFWNGRTKLPFIIQPVVKINPIDLVEGKNETRGQKMIMAKMLKDQIKIKDKGSMKGLLIVVVVIGVGYVLGKYVFKLF